MARGWAAFPVNGKIPATPKGVLDASTEERMSGIWFERFPDRGVALATGKPSGVWALDLDSEDAAKSWAAMQDEHRDRIKTVVSRTKRGYHVLFKMPTDDTDIRSSAGQVGDGIDVRGTGGYIVLPPSPHPDGGVYRWAKGRGPDEVAIAATPDWLKAVVTKKQSGAAQRAPTLPDTIMQGCRNETLMSLAGSLRRRGGSRMAIFAAIQVENATRCSPPLSDGEVEKIADSVARYEPGPSAVAGERLSPTQIFPEAEPLAFPGPSTATELMDQPEPEVEWLAEGFLPAGGNVLVAGYPKTFKTTLLQDLAVSLASGSPFLDKFPVDRVYNVGLVLMEGLEWQAAKRTRRLCQAHGLDPRKVGERIHIWHRPPLVLNPTIVGRLAEWVKELDIDVVILDAWSYVARGNSDDADEVTPQLQAFSGLRDTVPECTVILVHHGRKTKVGGGGRLTDDIRNSTAFGAWYDAGVLLARKDEQSPVGVRCELRDYPSPDAFTFTVQDEYPASEANGWRSSGYLRITASDKSVAQLGRDKRVEEVVPLVREFVRENPDCSKRGLREGVKGRGVDVDRAWNALAQAGEGVEESPEGPFKAAKLRLCVPASHGAPDTTESQRVPVSPPRRGDTDAQTVTRDVQDLLAPSEALL